MSASPAFFADVASRLTGRADGPAGAAGRAPVLAAGSPGAFPGAEPLPFEGSLVSRRVRSWRDGLGVPDEPLAATGGGPQPTWVGARSSPGRGGAAPARFREAPAAGSDLRIAGWPAPGGLSAQRGDHPATSASRWPAGPAASGRASEGEEWARAERSGSAVPGLGGLPRSLLARAALGVSSGLGARGTRSSSGVVGLASDARPGRRGWRPLALSRLPGVEIDRGAETDGQQGAAAIGEGVGAAVRDPRSPGRRTPLDRADLRLASGDLVGAAGSADRLGAASTDSTTSGGAATRRTRDRARGGARGGARAGERLGRRPVSRNLRPGAPVLPEGLLRSDRSGAAAGEPGEGARGGEPRTNRVAGPTAAGTPYIRRSQLEVVSARAGLESEQVAPSTRGAPSRGGRPISGGEASGDAGFPVLGSTVGRAAHVDAGLPASGSASGREPPGYAGFPASEGRRRLARADRARSWLPRIGGLLPALARAGGTQELIQAILARAEGLSALAPPGARAGDAEGLVERGPSAWEGGEERALGRLVREVGHASDDAQARGLGAGRERRGETVPSRAVREVQRDLLRGAPLRAGPAVPGAGADRERGSSQVMKLANKLMKLIHLAESERKVRDAQARVRMAEDTVDARREGGVGMGASGQQVDETNIKALQQEVLEHVLRELELLQARREDPDGRNIWW